MVYHEAAQYTDQLPPDQTAFYRPRLVVLWSMFSELEQAESLIQTGAVTPAEVPALDALAAALEARICPLRDLDGLRPDGLPRDELYYVLDRYLENARTLCPVPSAAPSPSAAD